MLKLLLCTNFVPVMNCMTVVKWCHCLHYTNQSRNIPVKADQSSEHCHTNYVASYITTSGAYTAPTTSLWSRWEALDCEAGSSHGYQHLHHRGLQAVPPLCAEDLPEAYKICPAY